MEYFRNHPDSGVTSPSQVAIVGDRLFTDVMMANMMGSYGFWIKDGVIERKSFVSLTLRNLGNVVD
jgi:phosphatidylglycerophosphatase GEP4